MYNVLCFNPDDPNSTCWPASYSRAPEVLPATQLECTDEQHANYANYKVVNGQIVSKTNSELLAIAKKAAIVALNKSCAEAITSGFKSNALGADHTYPSNSLDQTNLQSAVSAAHTSISANVTTWESVLMCMDANNVWSFISHNAAAVIEVGSDWHDYVTACRVKLSTLAAQINSDATDTTDKLSAIVW